MGTTDSIRVEKIYYKKYYKMKISCALLATVALADNKKVPPRHPLQRLQRLTEFSEELLNEWYDFLPSKDNWINKFATNAKRMEKISNVVINDADFTMNLSFLMAVLSQRLLLLLLLPLQLQQLPLLPPLQRLRRLRLQPQLLRNLKRRATKVKEIRRRATRADLDVILMLMSDMTVRTLPLEQSKSQPVSQNGLTGT